MFFLGLILGAFGFMFLFEPFIINFIYFTNIPLFFDLFVTKKNKEKLRRYFNE